MKQQRKLIENTFRAAAILCLAGALSPAEARQGKPVAHHPGRAHHTMLARHYYGAASHAVPMEGIASKYAVGRKIASPRTVVQGAMTMAHPSLPFGTRVLVTNRANDRSVCVTVNDRGPNVGGRIADLSLEAARRIGMGGLARVILHVVLGCP